MKFFASFLVFMLLPFKAFAIIQMGRCAIGAPKVCYQKLIAGIPKQDRAHVKLVDSNGVYTVITDPSAKSDSRNFLALEKLSADSTATVRIDVLKPNDTFNVRLITSEDLKTGQVKLSTMPMRPGNPKDKKDNSFVGYTFYPYSKGPLGPYTTGNFSLVVVNSQDPDGITPTLHHELRHVLLGNFGRVAPYGAHHTGNVDLETKQAEDEANVNLKAQ